MKWGTGGKKSTGFFERLTEFLNAEIPEYAFTMDTIYFCCQCDICIPKEIYDKNKGVCSKCIKSLR